MRRYRKSIVRGHTFPMYSTRSLSDNLFGMFLIITVVRVSSPAEMRSRSIWFFSLLLVAERPPADVGDEREGEDGERMAV